MITRERDRCRPHSSANGYIQKKLIDIARPRERFGTTSRMAEKPHAVTIPDNAKYAGTENSTTVTCAALIAAATGRIDAPAMRQTLSFRDQPPRIAARSANHPADQHSAAERSS